MKACFKQHSRMYAIGLGLLLVTFIARVSAQLIQYIQPVIWLPPVDRWDSSVLPYALLLITQLIIVFCFAVIVVRFSRGIVKPNQYLGMGGLWFGSIYFAVMLIRLIIGFIAPEYAWFSYRIPTLFHLVLASFILLWANFHYRYGHYER